MATALARTSQEAAWLTKGARFAPKTAALRRRLLAVLTREYMALPLSPWAIEMSERLTGLLPALDWHLWHDRELEADFFANVEETVRRAEVIES